MATRLFSAQDAELNSLYQLLSEQSLQPLWELSGLLTAEPRSRAVPYRWRGEHLRNLSRRAGDLVPAERGGDRRVLACSNPGLGGAPYAVSTLWAGVQYLGGYEYAPAHRHTPAALRFVLEGGGVSTVVDGDPMAMAAGDLVLTPSWTFHEHYNPQATPMIWVDVLDLPIVASLEAVFFEQGTDKPRLQQDVAASASENWYGGGVGLAPADEPRPAARHSPLLVYRWAETDRALEAQLRSSATGHARLRFMNPARGGDVMPTLRCEFDRVRGGHVTSAMRQTGGRVACVLHGAGTIHVGSCVFDVAAGDMVAIPSWTHWYISAEADLDLFSTTDAPVLEALGLYRDEVGDGPGPQH
jgi:gentisate 1,2-dioxygenase